MSDFLRWVGFEGGPCGALGGSIFNFLPPSFLQRADIRLGKAWGDSKIPGVALSVQKQNALIGAFLYVPKPTRPTGGPPFGTGNEVRRAVSCLLPELPAHPNMWQAGGGG